MAVVNQPAPLLTYPPLQDKGWFNSRPKERGNPWVFINPDQIRPRYFLVFGGILP